MPSPPDPGFVVRPGRRGDARSFLELWRDVVDEGQYVRTDVVTHGLAFYRREFFRRSWTSDQASIVAVAGDRVIGHLTVSREESSSTRHVASLGMTVAADWRGRGVGSALLAEAIRWAGEVGVEKLALSVYPHNERALALYRKFGFREEGRLTGHSRKRMGYLDEIVMGRWLDGGPSSTPSGSSGAAR